MTMKKGLKLKLLLPVLTLLVPVAELVTLKSHTVFGAETSESTEITSLEKEVEMTASKALKFTVAIKVVPKPEFVKSIAENFKKIFRRAMPQEVYNALVEGGSGSGFIVAKNGSVLTNRHVIDPVDAIQKLFAPLEEFTDKKMAIQSDIEPGLIEETTDIPFTYTVTLGGNSEELDANLIAVDHTTDLALIKIANAPTDLSIATFADSSNVGHKFVLAIGSPFDFKNTVTFGIISNASSECPQETDEFKCIQTDAAINPGNSGGPLVFLSNGEVVGVNTAIVGVSGGNVGLGFTIPSNIAKDFVDMVKDNKENNGYLGINVDTTAPPLNNAFPTHSSNLSVEGIDMTGPAQGALQELDIIIEINGRVITDPQEFRRYIAGLGAGSNVNIKFWREGETKEVTITLS